MKIIETIIKSIVPSVAILLTLFPFFCLLRDRDAAFTKILELLLGNVWLVCIIVVELVIIWSLIDRAKTVAGIYEKENERLVAENNDLKEGLKSFTTAVLDYQKQEKNG